VNFFHVAPEAVDGDEGLGADLVATI